MVAVAVGVFAATRSESEPRQTGAARAIEIPGNTVAGLGTLPQAPANPPGVEMPAANSLVGSCQVQVTGQNADSEPVVLVFFSHPAGIRRASRRVPTAPASLRFDNLPVGRYQISIARSVQCARLAYLSRAELKIEDGQVTAVSLPCNSDELTLKLALSGSSATGDSQASIAGIPVFLRRVSDPAWRYRQPFSGDAGEILVRSNLTGNVVFKDLGPGRYRLDFDGFQTAQEDQARLTFELGAFDSSRPIRGSAH